MKFKYSAFTNNTPEMREWLEKLGYSVVVPNDEYGDTLFVFESGIADAADLADITIIESYDNVNCLNNPELFKAVTAITDDSDKNKHFICFEIDEKKLNKDRAQFEIDEKYIAQIGEIYKSNNTSFNSTAYKYGKWRECSLSELQEHFKIEEK